MVLNMCLLPDLLCPQLSLLSLPRAGMSRFRHVTPPASPRTAAAGGGGSPAQEGDGDTSAAAAGAEWTTASSSSSSVDPSLADGSVVVYHRSLGIEVRQAEEPDAAPGTLLPIAVKVLVLYAEDNITPESVRVELSREDDLFFRTWLPAATPVVDATPSACSALSDSLSTHPVSASLRRVRCCCCLCVADMYHSLQERGFAALQARQKLLASFADFPQLLTQNLNNCLRDPHKYVDHAMQ
jgi:hypothetical protein